MANHALIIDHAVADFDTWKAAFDAHSTARKEASFAGHHLNRGADDPSRVVVFLPFEDRAKVDAFLQSPQLKAVMKEAGVISAPTITQCLPQEENVVWDRRLPALLIRHRVSDYQAWKVVYDKVRDLRKDNGIIGDAVNQAANDPNEVIIYHQAETREALDAFLARPELKAAMAEAGVAGPLDITILDGGVDTAKYN